jgi:glycosyltransferase involved in cell wall biosynthesis
MMNVLFAPDYCAGIPYQKYLADFLKKLDIDVQFLSNYRRGLPLSRGVADFPKTQILHLHWPEAYFAGDWPSRLLRKMRFITDLNLACRGKKLFLTAHNLLPHNRHKEFLVPRNVRHAYRKSDGVFVHSHFAKEQVVETFGVAPKKCWIIPYGDHAFEWGPPLDRAAARQKLGLPLDKKVCLVFGTVSPYKGSDDVLEYWVREKMEDLLVIAGPVLNETYAEKLRGIAAGSNNVDLRLTKEWLKDPDLHLWLSAVDCSIFNYREIFTSGAASLARSMGVPILIPERLQAADLHEPHPLVFRFDRLETDFNQKLVAALNTDPDFEAARKWREETSWEKVAQITKQAYEQSIHQ